MAHILQLEIVIPYPLSKSLGNQQTDFKSFGYLPKAMLKCIGTGFKPEAYWMFSVLTSPSSRDCKGESNLFWKEGYGKNM